MLLVVAPVYPDDDVELEVVDGDDVVLGLVVLDVPDDDEVLGLVEFVVPVYDDDVLVVVLGVVVVVGPPITEAMKKVRPRIILFIIEI